MDETDGDGTGVRQSARGGQPSPEQRPGGGRFLTTVSTKLSNVRWPTIFTTGISTIATFAGFLLLLFYPIAFISFWWQLRRYHSYDAVTALHAASAVPTNIVGGTLVDVQQALVAGGGAVLSFFLVTVVVYYLYLAFPQLHSRWKIFTFLAAIVLLSLQAVIDVWYYSRYYLQDASGWYFAARLLVPAVGGGFGGYFAFRAGSVDLLEQKKDEPSEQKKDEPSEQKKDEPRRGGVGRGGFILLAAFFALSAAASSTTILAALQYPALPYVEIKSQSQVYDGKRFPLLGHSDGYWYVLDTEPRGQEESASPVLSAVRDEKVERVQFHGRVPYAACAESVLTTSPIRWVLAWLYPLDCRKGP